MCFYWCFPSRLLYSQLKWVMRVWMQNAICTSGKLCSSREHVSLGEVHVEERSEKAVSTCTEMVVGVKGIADLLPNFHFTFPNWMAVVGVGLVPPPPAPNFLGGPWRAWTESNSSTWVAIVEWFTFGYVTSRVNSGLSFNSSQSRNALSSKQVGLWMRGLELPLPFCYHRRGSQLEYNPTRIEPANADYFLGHWN